MKPALPSARDPAAETLDTVACALDAWHVAQLAAIELVAAVDGWAAGGDIALVRNAASTWGQARGHVRAWHGLVLVDVSDWIWPVADLADPGRSDHRRLLRDLRRPRREQLAELGIERAPHPPGLWEDDGA